MFCLWKHNQHWNPTLQSLEVEYLRCSRSSWVLSQKVYCHVIKSLRIVVVIKPNDYYGAQHAAHWAIAPQCETAWVVAMGRVWNKSINCLHLRNMLITVWDIWDFFFTFSIPSPTAQDYYPYNNKGGRKYLADCILTLRICFMVWRRISYSRLTTKKRTL